MAAMLGALGAMSGAGLNPQSMMNGISPFLQNMQNQNYATQNINQMMAGEKDLQNNYMSGMASQFTKYGLPGYMAFSGGAGQMPRTQFNMGGTNSYLSGPTGAKMPNVTNNYQQFANWGNPWGGGNSNGKFGVANNLFHQGAVGRNGGSVGSPAAGNILRDPSYTSSDDNWSFGGW
uniref:Uncharacterized protein n=1 Tax=Picornavirales sp. TaxID=1955153 RepID=A0A6M3YNX0_9VIRU|nr:MAG: hypothetical protein 3 [Picornavirales sp.]